MTVWIDAQLPPGIAAWIKQNFSINAFALRDLGLRDAEDIDIFKAAKIADAVIMTKDSDFLNLLNKFGPPPQVLWLTCGNTSNQHLQQILAVALPEALIMLEKNEKLIEIGGL
jgi:predicted nuclease of predicted toxin-antitoxin system